MHLLTRSNYPCFAPIRTATHTRNVRDANHPPFTRSSEIYWRLHKPLTFTNKPDRSFPGLQTSLAPGHPALALAPPGGALPACSQWGQDLLPLQPRPLAISRPHKCLERLIFGYVGQNYIINKKNAGCAASPDIESQRAHIPI